MAALLVQSHYQNFNFDEVVEKNNHDSAADDNDPTYLNIDTYDIPVPRSNNLYDHPRNNNNNNHINSSNSDYDYPKGLIPLSARLLLNASRGGHRGHLDDNDDQQSGLGMLLFLHILMFFLFFYFFYLHLRNRIYCPKLMIIKEKKRTPFPLFLLLLLPSQTVLLFLLVLNGAGHGRWPGSLNLLLFRGDWPSVQVYINFRHLLSLFLSHRLDQSL